MTLFYITSIFRTIGMSIAFSILPALVVERCFATYFLEDYERRRRSYISSSVIVSLCLIGILSCLTFHSDRTTLYHIVIFQFINIAAVVANDYIYRINNQYFYESNSKRIGFKEYSLGERYQIAENIKTSRMFKHIIFSISFFNTLCILCMVSDNFSLPRSVQNLAVTLFDFSVLLYGLIVPVVTYKNSDKWPGELRRIIRICLCYSKRFAIAPQIEQAQLPPVRLNSTFGRNMMLSQDAQGTEYFKILKEMWR